MLVGSRSYFNLCIEACKNAISPDSLNRSTSRAGRAVHRFAIRILKALHFKNYDRLADKRIQRLKNFENEFQCTLDQFKMPEGLGADKSELFKEWKMKMGECKEALVKCHPEKNLKKPGDILFTHWALRSALRIAKSLNRDAKGARLEHSFLNFVAEKEGKLTPKFAKLSTKKKLAQLQINKQPLEKTPAPVKAKVEQFAVRQAVPDGNCLFHSLQMGLEIQQSIADFRIEVYVFMREHLDDYCELIQNVLISDVWDRVKSESDLVIATASLPENLKEKFIQFGKEKASDEDVTNWIQMEGVQAYLDGMSAIGCKSFAGSPELLAISNWYQRPIYVHKEEFSKPLVFGQDCPGEPIHLKLANKHYDLMIKEFSQ